jgi:hypothetical protein
LTNELLAEFLADEFLIRGYEWTFPGGKRIPNKDDMLEAFEELRKTTPDGHFQIAGHLVAVNNDGHFDIYSHVGELNE